MKVTQSAKSNMEALSWTLKFMGCLSNKTVITIRLGLLKLHEIVSKKN